ncbi:tumor necrosis factor receptor superfamily member 14-like isoform X2 [Petaurus breviceps papuanus]|uniref:tumor necrosis factor receptor superfamily member 14-like isoform X2 n=1 Tax=Petaurus breviceps papuanus TaxID=3040969 RepID=UPI0036D78CE5
MVSRGLMVRSWNDFQEQRTFTPHNATPLHPLKPRWVSLHQAGEGEFGLMTRRECSSTSNTVCRCSPGYFCADIKGDTCELCQPHQVCAPGQYMKSRGTERSNTICEKCQAGTFSPSGTLGQCLPWTKFYLLGPS